jgi:hypothetical protein
MAWGRPLGVAALAVALSGTTGAGVTIAAPGKARTATTISSGVVTITITTTTKGNPPPPPAAIPTFTLDLYDSDVAFDDALGVDATEVSPGVVGAGWVPGALRAAPFCPQNFRRTWSFTYTVPNITLGATDTVSSPDPYVAVTTAGPGAGTTCVGVPDLPTIGMGDLGWEGPTRIANSDPFYGYPAAAFSRGHDDISGLGASAALYFVSDRDTQILSPSIPATPGLGFVFDAAGDLWPEEAHGAAIDPVDDHFGPIRFLNLNTAPAGGGAATSEVYFVDEGTSLISYTATANPASASMFLDVGSAVPVTALAVEDVAPRGTWSAGDQILYALLGNSAIFHRTFGGAASFLTFNGHTFDGSAVPIDFAHLDDAPPGMPIPTLAPGSILALAVSSPGAALPVPPDRVTEDPVDDRFPGFLPFDCGPGTPAVLAHVSGPPSLGAAFVFTVDDVSGSATVPSIPVLLVSNAPAPGPPCGAVLPVLGPDAILISLFPPNPIVIRVGAPWLGPGSPVPFPLAIPFDPSLLGRHFYTQGFLATLGPLATRNTNLIELIIGP